MQDRQTDRERRNRKLVVPTCSSSGTSAGAEFQVPRRNGTGFRECATTAATSLSVHTDRPGDHQQREDSKRLDVQTGSYRSYCSNEEFSILMRFNKSQGLDHKSNWSIRQILKVGVKPQAMLHRGRCACCGIGHTVRPGASPRSFAPRRRRRCGVLLDCSQAGAGRLAQHRRQVGGGAQALGQLGLPGVQDHRRHQLPRRLATAHGGMAVHLHQLCSAQVRQPHPVRCNPTTATTTRSRSILALPCQQLALSDPDP